MLILIYWRKGIIEYTEHLFIKSLKIPLRIPWEPRATPRWKLCESFVDLCASSMNPLRFLCESFVEPVCILGESFVNPLWILNKPFANPLWIQSQIASVTFSPSNKALLELLDFDGCLKLPLQPIWAPCFNQLCTLFKCTKSLYPNCKASSFNLSAFIKDLAGWTMFLGKCHQVISPDNCWDRILFLDPRRLRVLREGAARWQASAPGRARGQGTEAWASPRGRASGLPEDSRWPIRCLHSYFWPIRGPHYYFWTIRGLNSYVWPITGLLCLGWQEGAL